MSILNASLQDEKDLVGQLQRDVDVLRERLSDRLSQQEVLALVERAKKGVDDAMIDAVSQVDTQFAAVHAELNAHLDEYLALHDAVELLAEESPKESTAVLRDSAKDDEQNSRLRLLENDLDRVRAEFVVLGRKMTQFVDRVDSMESALEKTGALEKSLGTLEEFVRSHSNVRALGGHTGDGKRHLGDMIHDLQSPPPTPAPTPKPFDEPDYVIDPMPETPPAFYDDFDAMTARAAKWVARVKQHRERIESSEHKRQTDAEDQLRNAAMDRMFDALEASSASKKQRDDLLVDAMPESVPMLEDAEALEKHAREWVTRASRFREQKTTPAYAEQMRKENELRESAKQRMFDSLEANEPAHARPLSDEQVREKTLEWINEATERGEAELARLLKIDAEVQAERAAKQWAADVADLRELGQEAWDKPIVSAAALKSVAGVDRGDLADDELHPLVSIVVPLDRILGQVEETLAVLATVLKAMTAELDVTDHDHAVVEVLLVYSMPWPHADRTADQYVDVEQFIFHLRVIDLFFDEADNGAGFDALTYAQTLNRAAAFLEGQVLLAWSPHLAATRSSHRFVSTANSLLRDASVALVGAVGVSEADADQARLVLCAGVDFAPPPSANERAVSYCRHDGMPTPLRIASREPVPAIGSLPFAVRRSVFAQLNGLQDDAALPLFDAIVDFALRASLDSVGVPPRRNFLSAAEFEWAEPLRVALDSSRSTPTSVNERVVAQVLAPRATLTASVVWDTYAGCESAWNAEVAEFVTALEPSVLLNGAAALHVPAHGSERHFFCGEWPAVLDARLSRVAHAPVPNSADVWITDKPPPSFATFPYQGAATQHERPRYVVGRAMYDTDTAPEQWAQFADRVDELWLPSPLSVDAFVNAGFERAQLSVVPRPVNLDLFNGDANARVPPRATVQLHDARTTLDRTRFLVVGEWTDRKGVETAVRAYYEAFQNDDLSVLLILNTWLSESDTSQQNPIEVVRARLRRLASSVDSSVVRRARERNNADVLTLMPRIVLIVGRIEPRYMPALYQSAHCLLSTGTGEAWGTPLVEAMAMGLTVVASEANGAIAYLQAEQRTPPEPIHFELPCNRTAAHGANGNWCEPSVAQVIDALRNVLRNTHELARMGLAARDHVTAHLSHKTVAKLVIDKIETKLKAQGFFSTLLGALSGAKK